MGTGINLGTSTTWPTAKLVVYIPFMLSRSFKVQSVFWQNGTTPVGNIDVGVYDSAGNRKYRTGSTGAGTTAAIQTVAPTAFTLVGPGLYYMAMTCDNVGGSYTYAGPSTAPTAGISGSLGIMTETTGSFGLTDPWGTVAVLTASEIIPNMGLANGTVI